MTAGLPPKPDRINGKLIRERCAGIDGAVIETRSRQEYRRRTGRSSERLPIEDVEYELDSMPPDDVPVVRVA